MNDEDNAADDLGWLETYELPDLGVSEWGAAPVLDEGWDG